jgi:hypothetical protein
VYRIGSPVYRIGNPEYRIGSPVYRIGSPVYRIGSPEYRIGSPVYRIGKKFAVLVPLGLILGKNYPLFMLFVLFFTSSLNLLIFSFLLLTFYFLLFTFYLKKQGQLGAFLYRYLPPVKYKLYCLNGALRRLVAMPLQPTR